MKSVVLKTKNHKAVLLDGDGTFRLAANQGYHPGQVLRRGATPLLRRVTAIAAAAVLLLSGGSALAYYTPVSYASVDINPSIEFQMNLIGHVIGVRGVNEDGKALLSHIQTGANLGQNIQAVVREAVAEGYLPPDADNTVVVTIANSNEAQAQQTAEQAQERAQEALQQTGTPAQVEVDRVGYDRVQAARELGTTPGKLNLVQKYIASAGDGAQVDVQEWLKKPVKEIMKAIKANRKAAQADEPTASASPAASATPTAVSPTPAQSAPTTTPTVAATPTKSPAPTATAPRDDGNHGKGNDDKEINDKGNTGKGLLDSPKPEETPKPSKSPKPTRTPKPTHSDDGTDD